MKTETKEYYIAVSLGGSYFYFYDDFGFTKVNLTNNIFNADKWHTIKDLEWTMNDAHVEYKIAKIKSSIDFLEYVE